MNQLKRLEACGQSPWLDYLKRSLIEKGELHTLVARDGLKGVTSLDSTDPTQIATIERAVDLGSTLFIVSSKSGSTLEPNTFLDYFFDRVGAVKGKDKAGNQFVAVTDPGSPLERRARQLHFACVFHGVPSIGGRYSVLSNFGLTPATAMGLDVGRLIETTWTMQRSCGADVPPSENPGVQLGVAIGVAATRFGRDKVTIIASPGIVDFGAWLEQLLAESTGKQGRGLIPIAGEPLTVPERYGNDRFFAYLELDGQVDLSQRVSSWLLDLAAAALVKDPQLNTFSGYVQDSGEGRWTVEAAIEEAVPADVLSTALYASFRSRQQHTFGEKLLSAMRLGFGGHIEGRESIDPEPTSEALQGHPATQNAAD